jgi:hypothetical protein
METVVLDGVKYMKASAAATKFKYTSDYIGQLCRAKKIDARLVGRTWFVNPESLKDYKTTKYEKNTDEPKAFDKVDSESTTIKIKTERVKVSSTLKNKTIKSVRNSSVPAARLKSDNARQNISFGPDSSRLIPVLNKSDESQQSGHESVRAGGQKFLHVQPALAKKLKINKLNKKHTNFTASELPDVALSGKLNISDYSSSPMVTTPAVDTQAITSDTVIDIRPVEPLVLQPGPNHDEIDLRKTKKKRVMSNFVPRGRFQKMLPGIVVVSSLMVAFMMFVATSEIEVSGLLSSSKVSLQVDKIFMLFTQ